MDHLTIYAHVLKHTYAYTSNALQECGGKVTAKKRIAIYKSLMSTYHAARQGFTCCYGWGGKFIQWNQGTLHPQQEQWTRQVLQNTEILVQGSADRTIKILS